MKLISKTAMATALALGSIAMLAAPAVAQKKEKKAKAPELKLSAEVRKALGEAQNAIKAGNVDAAKAKLAEADAAAKTPDEKYMTSQIRIELGTKANDPKIQEQGVRDALASGSLPEEEQGRFNFFAGKFAYDRGDFQAARTSLAEAERRGFNDPNLYLLLAEANFKASAVPAGLGYIEKAIAAEQAAGKTAPQSWYARAASVAYQGKLNAEAAKWTRMQVKAYPSAENWRSALFIYRDTSNLDNQAMLDLQRLMRITKSLAGERDYFEYASNAFDRGIFGEAKAVIDEGKAAGALNAANQAINDVYTAANGKITSDRKELATAEKEAQASTNFRIASGTADALLGYGEDARAIALYQAALQKGATDKDQINTRIGIARTRTGDVAGARQAFSAVNPSGPRGQLVSYWLLYLDQQAGGGQPAAAAPTSGN